MAGAARVFLVHVAHDLALVAKIADAALELIRMDGRAHRLVGGVRDHLGKEMTSPASRSSIARGER
jgi:hypothetical protein